MAAQELHCTVKQQLHESTPWSPLFRRKVSRGAASQPLGPGRLAGLRTQHLCTCVALALLLPQLVHSPRTRCSGIRQLLGFFRRRRIGTRVPQPRQPLCRQLRLRVTNEESALALSGGHNIILAPRVVLSYKCAPVNPVRDARPQRPRSGLYVYGATCLWTKHLRGQQQLNKLSNQRDHQSVLKLREMVLQLPRRVAPPLVQNLSAGGFQKSQLSGNSPWPSRVQTLPAVWKGWWAASGAQRSMSWLLSSIVGSGAPKLPFTLGEPYSEAWGAWTHHRATTKVRRAVWSGVQRLWRLN